MDCTLAGLSAGQTFANELSPKTPLARSEPSALVNSVARNGSDSLV